MTQPRSLRQYLLLYAASFLALVALAGALGGLSLYLWHQASRETLRLNSMMREVQEMRGSLYRQLKEVFDAVFLDDEQAVQEYRQYESVVERHLAWLDTVARGEEERDAVAGLRKAYRVLAEQVGPILSGHGDMPMAQKQRLLNTELEARGLKNHEEAIAALERLLRLQQETLVDRLTLLNRLAPLLLILPILVALLLLLLSRLFLRRAVVSPLRALERATRTISQGRLDTRVPEQGPSELVSLAQAVNRMAGDLAASADALRRTEKQATLGALVPVLAHNIRNPIASIRATAQLVQEGAQNDEVREDLAGIIDTADRLERWTAALLSYLHPLKPQLAACRLSTVLDTVLAMLKARCADKNLSAIRAGFSDDPPVTGDVALLEQAMHGLLVNAIEASARGGAIDLSLEVDADVVNCSIVDRGPGIPFTPVTSQLTPGPTTKRYGTGLGIPFAIKVFEEHHGKIVFTKLEPRGTRVRVSLPRALAEE
jgi:signal transduction histidine kinase